MVNHNHASPPQPGRLRFWLGVGVSLAILVFLLWEEHRVHLLGALPWLILLACPLMHVFMHGGHGSHGGHGAHGGHEEKPKEDRDE